jgi:hypothetical protein
VDDQISPPPADNPEHPDRRAPSPAQLPDWQRARVEILTDALGDIPMATEEHAAVVQLAGLTGDAALHLAAVIRRARAAGPTQPPTPEETWEQQVTSAIREVFHPHVATEILTDDAFGALAYRLRQQCQAAELTPAQVLRGLPDHDRSFCGYADQPAAFLAARLRDGGDQR